MNRWTITQHLYNLIYHSHWRSITSLITSYEPESWKLRRIISEGQTNLSRSAKMKYRASSQNDHHWERSLWPWGSWWIVSAWPGFSASPLSKTRARLEKWNSKKRNTPAMNQTYFSSGLWLCTYAQNTNANTRPSGVHYNSFVLLALNGPRNLRTKL